jgi:hypothetical protein
MDWVSLMVVLFSFTCHYLRTSDPSYRIFVVIGLGISEGIAIYNFNFLSFGI